MNADLVLVCVPVESTPEVIHQCSIYMKQGAALGEIASVKGRTFAAMSGLREDILPLCLHPMFGPGAADGKQLKFLYIPIRNARKEHEKIRELFRGSTILKIESASEHDDLVGTVLGLTYFLNLVLADIIYGKNTQKLEAVAGTTFKLQSIIAQSIMSDSPELAGALIAENPQALRQIQDYIVTARAACELASIDNKKFVGEIARIKKRLQKRDIQTAYKKLYEAVRAIEG